MAGERVRPHRQRPGRIKASIDWLGRQAGSRNWESFSADPSMMAIAEQVLKLVRAERIDTRRADAAEAACPS